MVYEEILDPTKGNIKTYRGHYFNFINPNPEQIDIIDIANSLSKECHFGNQLKNFYSVAQHSLWVCDIAPDDLKIIALLHDASEAYTGDIVKPLKLLIPRFKEIEDTITKAIFKKFGADYSRLHEIKPYDKQVQADEANYFWNNIGTLPYEGYSFDEVQNEFIERFFFLINHI